MTSKEISKALGEANKVVDSDPLKAFDILSVVVEKDIETAKGSRELQDFCNSQVKRLLDEFEKSLGDRQPLDLHELTQTLQSKSDVTQTLNSVLMQKLNEWKNNGIEDGKKISYVVEGSSLGLPQYFLDLLARIEKPNKMLQDRLLNIAIASGDHSTAWSHPTVQKFNKALEDFVDSFLKSENVGLGLKYTLRAPMIYVLEAEITKKPLAPDAISIE